MALTKLPAQSIVDGTITSAKIQDATITASDLATGSITVDKLSTTFDISSHTLTLPADAVTHRELAITYTSPTHDDKFLQINSSGEFVWADPGTYPIAYSAITGPIPASHIAAGMITSAMIGNQEVADANIADGTITPAKLNSTLDLSTKTITYPTDNSLTNLTVTGNLHVQGTTTEIDTQNLLVKDNIIVINDEETGPGVSAAAAGIEINRGPGQDKATIMWDEASSSFEFRLGPSTVDLTFGSAGTPADSIGYDQLKINNQTDPGPVVNTFLQSAGDGTFNFTAVNYDNFLLSGAINGTLASNTLTNYSVTTLKLADRSITSAKLDTTISFVGKTVVLNAGDILTAINSAGYFNVTNPNLNLPNNSIDSGNIQDGAVTGYKLATTLDLSAKTLTYPDNITFQNLTVDGNFTVNGTSTTINTALETSEGLEISPIGNTVGLLIDSTSSGHILQLQKNSVDVLVVDNSGDARLKQNLIIDKNLLERSGTVSVNGTIATIDLDLGGHFVLELEGITGDITEIAISNIDLTPGVVITFMLKVIQGSVDRTIAWSGISYIKWPENMGDGSLLGLDAPIITSGNDKEDLFKFTSYDNGASWYGQILGMDYSAPGPTVIVTSATISNTSNAVVQSNATGTAYLINTTVSPLYLESHITGAATNLWNSVAISSPNTNTNLPATGLIDGTYRAYAVNNAGTLSIASVNSVTLDSTGPIVSVTATTITSSGIAEVQSTETGTVYLVNTTVTVTNLASITGAADDQWNSVTITTANTDTNLAATGLADGTYKAYAEDSLGNFSSTPSANSITIGAVIATGGTETTYGNYTVHTFTASGTFTISQAGSADIIVVAGGGGGTGSGNQWGGGGGAGGVVVCTNKFLSAQSYPIVIGSGGTGNSSTPSNGNGTDSTFAGIITKGGGGSGGYQDYNASSGGSGGGAPGKSPWAGTSTQQSAGNSGGGTGYGNEGGGKFSGYGTDCAGSGGGAGSKGYAAELDGPNYTGSWSNAASPGGIGIQNDFQTGLNQWYAGGGASGNTGSTSPSTESGGAGGGGNTATNGTPKTGGGGGGGGTTTGGSGIVIIRYMN